MKSLIKADRSSVYNAPTIPWNSDTYTPLANKTIMDLIENKIQDLGLVIKNENYKVTSDTNKQIKGVIGAYDIFADDEEFGQRIMFRNSYDKSMSFAFCCGSLVWICENGCVSGDYVYKRIHKGVNEENTSTTLKDVISNITSGFNALQEAFEHNTKQLNELKHFQIGPSDVYNLLGELFFNQEVLNVSQISIIKKELEFSKNFRHLGDLDFTAYDLYNHITESLKTSHPNSYLSNHINTHSLFEKTFSV